MLTILLLATAHAASPVDELRAIIDENPQAPEVAVACSPLSKLVEVAAAVPLPPSISNDLLAKAGGRYWADLLKPGAAAKAGFDMDGSLSFSVSDASDFQIMRVPFSGSDEQVAAMLVHGSAGQVTPDADAWIVTDKKGEDTLVERVPYGLRVARAPSAGPGGLAGLQPMFDGLPDSPGCVVYIASAKNGETGGFAGAAVVPLSIDGSFLFRMKADKAPPEALERSLGVPSGGSSTTRPNGVLVLSVSLLDLLEDLPGGEKLPQEQIERVQRVLHLDDGLTLAVFGDPKALDMAVALPVHDGRGRPRKARKTMRQMRKALEREGVAVDKVSRVSFRMLVEDRVVYVAARDGLVALGTNAVAVAETIDGLGTPWIGPELGVRLSDWPVAMSVDLPGGTGGMVGGLRARIGLWEFEMALDLGAIGDDAAQRQAMLTGMLAAIAVPNFIDIQNKANRAEVPSTVESIATSLVTRRAAGGTLGPLPAVPRPPSAVDAETLLWQPAGSWAELGLPETSLRGSYWVEIDESGAFTVHGVIDSDGDGQPAHYRVIDGGEIEQLTDPSIY